MPRKRDSAITAELIRVAKNAFVNICVNISSLTRPQVEGLHLIPRRQHSRSIAISSRGCQVKKTLRYANRRSRPSIVKYSATICTPSRYSDLLFQIEFTLGRQVWQITMDQVLNAESSLSPDIERCRSEAARKNSPSTPTPGRLIFTPLRVLISSSLSPPAS